MALHLVQIQGRFQGHPGLPTLSGDHESSKAGKTAGCSLQDASKQEICQLPIDILTNGPICLSSKDTNMLSKPRDGTGSLTPHDPAKPPSDQIAAAMGLTQSKATQCHQPIPSRDDTRVPERSTRQLLQLPEIQQN